MGRRGGAWEVATGVSPGLARQEGKGESIGGLESGRWLEQDPPLSGGGIPLAQAGGSAWKQEVTVFSVNLLSSFCLLRGLIRNCSVRKL